MATIPAIRFEGVSKRYMIDQARARATPEPARPWWPAVRRALGRRATDAREEVWALRDATFDVAQGEVFAVVGANGAGKSTLLKLLSRVARPTTGWIGLKGRLSSLLEIGTGFHPDLTGRENVFLNGLIMGLTRPEIRERFDRIVDFSGVERYLDTPVKRYSSGMYVRLAFSVAAHLDHEVMVVDEVLAVGDAAFRERCLARIDELVRDEGRTVLFVSHDLSQVRRLAHRAMLLDEGRVREIGAVDAVLGTYLGGADSPADPRSWDALDLRLVGPGGAPTPALASGAPGALVMTLGAVPEHARADVTLEELSGRVLWQGGTWLARGDLPLRCDIAHLPLRAGRYRVRVALRVRDHLVSERASVDLVVSDAPGSPSGLLAEAPGSPSGLLPEAPGSPSGLLPEATGSPSGHLAEAPNSPSAGEGPLALKVDWSRG